MPTGSPKYLPFYGLYLLIWRELLLSCRYLGLQGLPGLGFKRGQVSKPSHVHSEANPEACNYPLVHPLFCVSSCLHLRYAEQPDSYPEGLKAKPLSMC